MNFMKTPWLSAVGGIVILPALGWVLTDAIARLGAWWCYPLVALLCLLSTASIVAGCFVLVYRILFSDLLTTRDREDRAPRPGEE